jgi:hypothetical protein
MSDPTVALLFGIGAGTSMFWHGFTTRSHYLTISRTPVSKIHSLAVGQVEISGRVKEHISLLVSPFSLASCVYYNYKVEELRSHGKSSSWDTIAEKSSKEEFYVEDDSGKILVNPVGAELHLKPDFSYNMCMFNSAQEEKFKAGLDKIGINYSGWLFDKKLRCTEICIMPDDKVFIFGTAQTRINQESSPDNPANLHIASCRGSYFVLSDYSEKELLSEISSSSYFLIVVGPLITVICLGFLFANFGWF